MQPEPDMPIKFFAVGLAPHTLARRLLADKCARSDPARCIPWLYVQRLARCV
jgi:hypothetical protein